MLTTNPRRERMVRVTTAAITLAATFVCAAAAAGAEPVMLLDFWSPQCGPCMQMKPTMHSFEQAGYPIRQVDTTRDGQLPRQYNVNQIPCFVMLVNGQEVERQVGATSSESIKQMFDRANAQATQIAKDQARIREGTRGQSPDARAAAPPFPQPNNSAGGPVQQPPEPVSPPNNPPGIPEKSPPAAPGSHAALLSATVRLIVEDAQGRSFGTGTIVDTRSGEALVVTCAHLFRDSQGKQPVNADLFESVGDGVRVAGHAKGQVLTFDLTRDVALVSIHLDRPVTAVTIPPRSTVDRGDRVVGVGCSNGNDPTVLESRVTSLDRYQGPPNIEAAGAPAIGRSGGGLFNAKNELIGVCNNADPEGNEGIYAGLESIHDQLDKLGLKDIYQKPGSGPPGSQPPSQAVAGANGVNGGPVVRGQEPPVTPLTNETAPPFPGTIATSGQTKSPSSRNLSETEQAALEEIMSRGVSSEVIVIVRPKDANGQSEMIHLDSVSPEFVQALKQHSVPTKSTR
jgi:thiol-disulfide isomerase/thioredoxin